MASSTPARDAALKAKDNRLLTPDWVDSNSRSFEHLRPDRFWNSFWSLPGHWTEPVSTARRTNNYHRGDCDSAGVKSDEIEDVEEADEELGFAEDLFQSCLYIFQELWLELSQLSPSPKCIRDGLLLEGLGKFYLWGESFQDGSLNTALAQSDELREDVLKLICQIGSILTRRLWPMVEPPSRLRRLDSALQHLTLLSEKVKPIISGSTSEANSDSDDTEEERAAPAGRHENEGTIGRDIRLLTGWLMELLPTLEQSLPRVGKRARSALLAPPPVFQVSRPAFTYVRNISDKFPRADVRLTERLGEANWQRHVKVRNMIDQIANGGPLGSKCFVVAPFSEFRDSALGSSIPNQSRYAASTAPHTSFVSSLADGEERSLRVPPTPAEVSAGKPFQCHICGQRLYRIRDRVDWQIHVFADLEPYICTFSTCNDALVKFPTRKMWADHEFDEHRVNRSWVCPECSAESFSPDAWDDHLQQVHNITFEGSQHAIVLDSARRMILKPIDEQQCPMCKVIPGSTRRAFSTHVGRHMEQIALAVLPREIEDDVEGSSVASDLPIHDQREGPSLGQGLALPPNAMSRSINRPQRSIFDDSEIGCYDYTVPVPRRAGNASSILTAPALLSVENAFNVGSNRPSRVWTDRFGSFTVEAQLLGLKDETFEQMTGLSMDWEKVETGDPAGSLAVHAYERPWQCDQCPRTFKRNTDLKRHKDIHEGVQREHCDKKFSRRHNLESHILSHLPLKKVKDDLVSPDRSEDEGYVIKCVCANEEDDGNTVLCEGCDTWQHIKCYFSSSQEMPDHHYCTDCVPRPINTKKTVERNPFARPFAPYKQPTQQSTLDEGGSNLERSRALAVSSVLTELLKGASTSSLDASRDAKPEPDWQYGRDLHAAAERGDEPMVQALLETVADADVQSREYGGALQAASAGGHETLVQILLQAGADANAQGGTYGTPLIAAVVNGHGKVMQTLLQAGADANAQGGGYGNALQTASARGDPKVVQMLLQAGADVNAQGGNWGSALQAASTEGHETVVQMLLEAGADANIKGGKYGSALRAASVRGHKAVVQLLLDKTAGATALSGDHAKGSHASRGKR